jgi:hypothetical protein
MYIVGADSAFDHDLEKALFNIKCNTLLLLLNGDFTETFFFLLLETDQPGRLLGQN